jgi:hypothetical protein
MTDKEWNSLCKSIYKAIKANKNVLMVHPASEGCCWEVVMTIPVKELVADVYKTVDIPEGATFQYCDDKDCFIPTDWESYVCCHAFEVFAYEN